jgi:hypothetical protein
MHNEAVVVLERNARLPDWLDAELGPDASIYVCSERPEDDDPGDFAERVTRRIEAGQFPRRARFCVLVVGDDSGRQRTLARGALLISLWELGRVIVLSDSAHPALEQLVAMYDAELRVKSGPASAVDVPDSVRRVA